MDSSNNLEQILKDVRSSYRLLYQFQKRILDIVDYSNKFYGRQCHAGWSKFSNATPKAKKVTLGLWSWDWLNLYMYNFTSDYLSISEDQYNFSIFLVSDTGYFLTNRQELFNEKETSQRKGKSNHTTKTDIENFASVELSESKLIFIAGKNLWECEEVFNDNFNNPKLVLEAHGKYEKGEGKMIFKSYNISQFENEKATKKNLNDFKDYCDHEGVILRNPLIDDRTQ
ncbi:hypothetical protein F0365_08015 [Nonlabens sp. Ci31]|jgi:hypothetical protein|uniref:hypothetical protein n=1 Tax=Nonlabens sp. Ci31 TaxID=2608253 RepID=UPI00146445F6|nr:hypothetical protein [Nonlabens sp. Ci31]QJP34346.1 hypothetical protein F0365_08015 [Nonlabens sp. Ci31]